MYSMQFSMEPVLIHPASQDYHITLVELEVAGFFPLITVEGFAVGKLGEILKWKKFPGYYFWRGLPATYEVCACFPGEIKTSKSSEYLQHVLPWELFQRSTYLWKKHTSPWFYPNKESVHINNSPSEPSWEKRLIPGSSHGLERTMKQKLNDLDSQMRTLRHRGFFLVVGYSSGLDQNRISIRVV